MDVASNRPTATERPPPHLHPSSTGFARSIASVVAGHAERIGDRDAFTAIRGLVPIERLTYRELFERSATIAGHLLRQVRPGDRVGLVFQPSLDTVTSLLACFYAGTIAVPIVPPAGRALTQRFAGIAADCRPAAVLTSTPTLAAIDRSATEAVGLPAEAWISVDRLPAVPPPPRDALTLPGSDDVAILQYTSGSTGDPRGVVITHGNLAAVQDCIQAGFGSSDQDRMVTWLPYEHDMGLVGGLLHLLWEGGACFLMSPAAFMRNPLSWLAAVSHFGATISGGPNFAYRRCVEAAASRPVGALRLDRWRIAFNGAEPVEAATLAAFADTFGALGFSARSFYPCYGLAEATLLVSGGDADSPPVTLSVDAAGLQAGHAIKPAGAAAGRVLVSSGIPRTSGGVSVVDAETFDVCSEGEVGEIWVAGSSVATGYWNRPAETAGTFGALRRDGAGPFLRTGDLGFMSGKELFVVGRLKDIVIVNGRNFHPHDIERGIDRRTHPAVRAGRTALVALDDGPPSNILVQEVDRSGLDATGPDLTPIAQTLWRAVLRDHGLSVDRVVLVRGGTLLWTTSGKLRRSATWQALATAADDSIIHVWAPSVRSRFQDGGDRARATETLRERAPDFVSADIRAFVGDWVAAAMDVPAESLDTETGWMDLGLDSEMAVAFVLDLESATGMVFSDTLLFDHPNIETLLRHLEEQLCR